MENKNQTFENIKTWVYNNFILVGSVVVAAIGFLGYKLYTKKK